MIAVGAGVGEHVQMQRRQDSRFVGAGLHGDAHRMPRRGRDELFLAGQLELDRTAGLERGQRQNILDEHLLLAAEAAADPFAKHPNLVRCEIEDIRQRATGQERRLGAGAHVEAAVGIDPGEAAMGFQRGMLDALGGERCLIGDRGLGQRGGDIAEFAVGFRHDVALRVGDAMFRGLVAVNDGRTRGDRLCRIEHRGENS